MLEVLVTGAATAFVAAMATSGWQTAYQGIVALFQRFATREQADAAQRALTENAAQVGDAVDQDRSRQRLRGGWEQRLEELLVAHPEARDALGELVADIQRGLPAAQQQWVQTVVASASGAIAAGAIHGNVIIHRPGHDSPAGDDVTHRP
ncbi:hypothetical protein ACFP2T_31355 [Plantactinospora solaniradicis]|uniref:Uncharacterized protein n=1 Tax=Plantactinospora solaniradicis TaxID=1723736 RepID=A0ABW1KIQ7_9ACTN